MISFGSNLKFLREKKNLSQEELAKKLQISRQSISKWEQGISYPSILYLIPLTKILDCTLEELLKNVY
ncbi:MAG: helix-turn-helix transcriptional regulator [Bacilli bacterium]|nr:helix-turn-helix transcriptional regulator [Bacilli bacterium]